MKKINLYLIVLCLLGCVACTDEDKVNNVGTLSQDYVLPQGKSPADSRIVEYYNSYKSYILYEYTQPDFLYGLSQTNNSYIYEKVDPQCMDVVLDLLEDIWFDLYPTEFHVKYMPYKIMVAKSISTTYSTCDFATMGNNGQSLYLNNCSEELKNLSAEEKRIYKNNLQLCLWNYWRTAGTLEFPEEFYKVSDYTRAAKDYDPENPDDPDFALARGFMPQWYAYQNRYSFSWCLYVHYQTKLVDSGNDLQNFMYAMLTRTAEEWGDYLTKYPLIKRKYDILRNWFLTKYKVDLKKIGEATY
ncbi:hypothetical protein [Butyricimonas synergistica]|uniref:hypothetical protein n=1 Tax=Butyricimonas synergistica TaxID=544644 RepID=UPI000366ED59|nr:hypothetical protein [Butyricimonas synergistica]